MQFLLIMGLGTLVAIWVVANQPQPRGRSRRYEQPDITSFERMPSNRPAWRGEAGEVFSTDEFDYLRKVARHQDDPQHWPPPFPPEQPKKALAEDC
jgi:hypothetical protein